MAERSRSRRSHNGYLSSLHSTNIEGAADLNDLMKMAG